MPNFNIYKTSRSLKRLSVFNPFTIHKKGKGTKATFALAWVCFFWGTTWLASKEGVKHMPAIQLAGIRQFIGGSLYVIFFLFKKAPWPKGKQWATILILSFLNFFLSNGLSTWGVQYISSGLGSIIGAIFPLWMVIIAIVGGEKLPQKAIIGLVMGFGGVCIIFYDHLKDFLNADFRFGIILSVAATISWAFGTLYTKKHAANFNPYFSLGLQMIISSIALLGGQKLISSMNFFDADSSVYNSVKMISLSEIPANSWWPILYLVVIGSVLTFVAYIYSLQHLPTSLASLYAYVNPIVAVLLGAIIFKERLNIFVGVGGAVTIAGVYLVNDTFRRKD
jgi:drug/metabolite transporter (DMT)-like permease